ncbi:amino acid adenylation domain-containing protein [Amycolatopsis sp. QT-25]|uniref:non-ribosomal peptide synthetase n=1 Tax=Amycolatopsis sp. QT-25 TaxID=3034022 RepID=UPI0023EDA199|nr:amino acid adenylation domain-containing protein [Amycolatopsis sp. QT-25]WET81652.1 amino acid adenylation domain-containing protein [Amycolatopsis sp. QT-25]
MVESADSRTECLHEFVRAHAEKTPDAVAVVHQGSWLTYRELDRRSALIAAHLQAEGVVLESIVGIFLDRTPELVIAIVAVLRAGAAYQPLDPSYPKARLEFMVDDAQPSIVLTDREHAGTIDCGDSALLIIDELDLGAAAPRPPLRTPDVHPDNVAVVLYTSGSTGRPKGACLTHRGFVGLLKKPNFVDLGSDDRIAQVSSPSFDAGSLEIWAMLVHGGGVVMIPIRTVLDPVALLAEVAAHRITVLALTSALINQQSYHPPIGQSALRWLLFGGEAINPQAVRSLRESGFRGRVSHMYGPTETSVFATFEPIPRTVDGVGRVPIGRPVCGSELYLLDDRFRPVPVDIPGEVTIGGDRLARAYLGSPRLTADRFRPNPFPHRAGGRAYRTGDLARYLPDGRIDFLGRMDRQVKVRGYRIEPGEVEAALAALPGVMAAVVRVHRIGSEPASLVGYVVPQAGELLEAQSVRAAAGEYLPPHMVPSVIMVLEHVPLTPNGKVDVARLPAPTRRDDTTGAFRKPETKAEKVVAELWQELLGLDQVAATDDFFAIGGHSLLAVRMMDRLAELTEVELSIGALFTSATVSGLAARIDAGTGTARAEGGLRRLRPGTGERTLVLVHPVGGSIYSYGPLAEALDPAVELLAFEALVADDCSLQELADRYLDELMEQVGTRPVLLGGWSVGGVIAHEIARLWEHRRGSPPPVLLIDSAMPATAVRPGRAEAELLFVEDLLRSVGEVPDPVEPLFDGRPFPEVVSDLLERLRGNVALGGVRAEDALARFDIFHWLYQAVHRHEPRAYSGNAYLLRAKHHRDAADRDWHDVCGSLQVHDLAADHYSILAEPTVRFVASTASSVLAALPATG